MVVKIAQGTLDTLFGRFDEHLYYNGQKESIALTMGKITGQENVLCRVHSSCLSAQVFNGIECDCREQFIAAQQEIQKENCGIIIWLEQEGKSNGHYALLKSLEAKKQGLYQTDAYEAIGFRKDARDYKPAAQILNDLGVKSIILMTNNPDKVDTLTDEGIIVTGTKKLLVTPDPNNAKLIETLRGKIWVGHTIDTVSLPK